MTRIVVNGLEEMQRYLALMPERANKAATLAINQTADRSGLSAIRKAMREEAAFPSRYLEEKKRLGVTKRAKDTDLEAIITGRSRPTSLARFVSGKTIRVNPGRASTLSQAFLVRLKAGQGPITDDNFNVGLAIRLGKNERIANKREMVPFAAGLYLLYGPSVDQVFRTVAAEKAPEVADLLIEEFKRQFARLGKE